MLCNDASITVTSNDTRNVSKCWRALAIETSIFFSKQIQSIRTITFEIHHVEFSSKRDRPNCFCGLVDN